MLSIFSKDDKFKYTPVLLDRHTTSPGNEGESAIIRNSPRPVIEVRQTEIYLKARRIYTRARRASGVRGSAIV